MKVSQNLVVLNGTDGFLCSLMVSEWVIVKPTLPELDTDEKNEEKFKSIIQFSNLPCLF